jgi:hypothetical protein
MFCDKAKQKYIDELWIMSMSVIYDWPFALKPKRFIRQ